MHITKSDVKNVVACALLEPYDLGQQRDDDSRNKLLQTNDWAEILSHIIMQLYELRTV